MVDGSSYLYRAFHALPPLTSTRGEPTGAVYGVINMLLKLLKEHEPRYVAVLFDAAGKTFRDEIYEQYKAQRTPMPDDLRRQIAPLHAIVRALGLPLLQIEGVEADDVIGTLAKGAADRGLETIISTIDKDMAQVVGDRVRIVNTMFDTTLDRDGVRRKFGVEPEQIVDYLALVGDTSDNIPGVPGIGAKSAAALLARFGSLDGIYENLERLHEAPVRGAARLAESLATHRGDAMLSRALATIRCDIPLDFTPEQLAPSPPDYARLRELYRTLEFGTLLRALPVEEAPPPPKPASAPTAHYETILDEAALDRWIARLAAPRASRSIPRRRASTTCTRRSSACPSPSRRARRPTCPSPTAIPRRRISSRASSCSSALRRSSRARCTRNSATTSSTTRTCSPITASRCAARATTRCSSPTCSTPRRRDTTSTPSRSGISLTKRSTTNT
jgi:DNA polymerase-1